jgi:hypothetical protein
MIRNWRVGFELGWVYEEYAIYPFQLAYKVNDRIFSYSIEKVTPHLQ